MVTTNGWLVGANHLNQTIQTNTLSLYSIKAWLADGVVSHLGLRNDARNHAISSAILSQKLCLFRFKRKTWRWKTEWDELMPSELDQPLILYCMSKKSSLFYIGSIARKIGQNVLATQYARRSVILTTLCDEWGIAIHIQLVLLLDLMFPMMFLKFMFGIIF